MKRKYLFIHLIVLGSLSVAISQNSISGVINAYSSVLSFSGCNKSNLQVTSTNGFMPGDKVLLIQMNGATVDLSNSTNFGDILDYGEVGNFEFNRIQGITGGDIQLLFKPIWNYNVSGSIQIVRVPEYTNVVAKDLMCSPWDGSIGGVLAFEVSETLTMEGDIDVSGLGFRGGRVEDVNVSFYHETNFFYPNNPLRGSAKGEGVSTIPVDQSYGKGKAANGGGGGNAHNAGGGGGGNVGLGGNGGLEYYNIPNSPTAGTNGIGGISLFEFDGQKAMLGGGGGAGHENDNNGTSGGSGGGIVIIKANEIISNGHRILANGGDVIASGNNRNDGQGGGGAGGTIFIQANIISSLLECELKGGRGGDCLFSDPPQIIGPGGGGGGGKLILSQNFSNVGSNVEGGINGIANQNLTNGAKPGHIGGIIYGEMILEDSIIAGAIPQNIPKTLCPNSQITINNTSYSQPGTVLDTIPGIQGCDTIVTYTISLAPFDMVFSMDQIYCADGRIDMDYTLCNLGSADLPPEVSVAFYDSDPTLGAANFLGILTVHTTTAQDSCFSDTFMDAGIAIGLADGDVLYTVANFDGSLPTPFTLDSFPVTGIAECDYNNNFDSAVVFLPPSPLLDLGPDVVLCVDSTVVFDAGPGFVSYLWQDSSTAPTFSATDPDVYWVEVTDSCGGVQRDSVLLTVSLLGDVKIADTTICPNALVYLNVPGFDTYNWAPAAGLSCTDCAEVMIQTSVSTVYTLLATTADGCVLMDTFLVEVFPLPAELDLGPDIVLCSDSTVVFDAGPDFEEYLWSDNSTAATLATNVPGIYWVEVVDFCGTVQRDSIFLTVSLLTDTQFPDTAICANKALTLSLPGFDQYNWAPAAGLSCTDCQTVEINPLVSTTYTLLAITDDGCILNDTFLVDVLPLPQLTEVIEFCPGESINIAGQTYSAPAVVMDTIPNPGSCDIVLTYQLQYATAPSSSVSIDCIDDINIPTLAGTGAVVVDYDLPDFFSDCPCPGVALTLTEGLPSGSLFPVKKTKVCYEARDSCGNLASCCFNVIVREALPCDVKEIGCMKYELLRITQNAQSERVYRIQVTNTCDNPMTYTAFELPNGVVAKDPANGSIYVAAPDDRDYIVRNPNFSPFYSIRFKSTTDSISNGEWDIFEYTLPPQSEPAYIHVISRLEPQVYYEAQLNTFNCPVMPEQKPAASRNISGLLHVFPNPSSGLLYADLSRWAGEQVSVGVLDGMGKRLKLQQLTADFAPQEVDLPDNLPGGLYFLEVQTAGGERQTVRFVVQ